MFLYYTRLDKCIQCLQIKVQNRFYGMNGIRSNIYKAQTHIGLRLLHSHYKSFCNIKNGNKKHKNSQECIHTLSKMILITLNNKPLLLLQYETNKHYGAISMQTQIEFFRRIFAILVIREHRTTNTQVVILELYTYV